MNIEQDTSWPSMPQIAARLFDTPLLMHPQKLRTIASVLAPRICGNMAITPEMAAAAQDPFLAETGGNTQANADRIGVVPVHGTLVQRGSYLGASGLTSYDAIREVFDEQMADPRVEAVLFDIDSGGGEAAGCFDLVDHIASRREEKPIYAFVNEHAYSGGYALASAAEMLILPRTGSVGSVGVVVVHLDQSGFNDKKGLTFTPIFAGDRKIDGWPHGPLSDEARAEIGSRVGRIYDIFTETVARNRNIDLQTVVDTQAGCFGAAEAVDLGLADGIASADEMIEFILQDLEERAAEAKVPG